MNPFCKGVDIHIGIGKDSRRLSHSLLTDWLWLCEREAYIRELLELQLSHRAATVVGRNGIPDHLIQALCHWSSSAFQLYIRTPAHVLALLPSRLS